MTDSKVDSKVGYLMKINNLIGKVSNDYTQLETRVNELNKNKSKVFDTNDEFMEWLTIQENVNSLVIGQCFYIRESDSPDYWYDGVQMLIIETDLQPLKNLINENDNAITLIQNDINSINNDLTSLRTECQDAFTSISNDLSNIINVSNTLFKQTLMRCVYPVGSIMLRYDNKTPSSLEGLSGTSWTQINSGYYLKTGTTSTYGQTGGYNDTGSHVLTVNEIPAHNHAMRNFGSDLYISGGSYGTRYSASGGYWDYGCCQNEGGGYGHTHTINPIFIYVVVYRRTA